MCVYLCACVCVYTHICVYNYLYNVISRNTQITGMNNKRENIENIHHYRNSRHNVVFADISIILCNGDQCLRLSLVYIYRYYYFGILTIIIYI